MIFTTFGNAVIDFVIKAFASLFIFVIDSIAYLLVAASYSIFVAVSELNIFATPEGAQIYDDIVRRLYMILSIAMIFVLAYFLILMIIDPDGNAGKTTSNLAKELIISLIAIAVLPTVYNAMAIFQQHVIDENTIGTIILGGSGLSGENAGKNVSMIVFTAFYHPVGSSYSEFIDNDGNMRDKEETIKTCDVNGSREDICKDYYEGLEAWLNNDDFSLYPLTQKASLRNSVTDEDGMTYMWILSTGCAVLVAYFFMSYAIDLGTRAVKLAFLQIISPVPIMLRMVPKAKKTYDTWFSEIKKTYLEVFLRLAVIFFIVLLCQNVPTFLDAIWGGRDSVEGGFIVTTLATVALILGLLKFAKDAPGLFKTMFAGDGSLFAGLDLKPGVRRRVTENDYAMRGLGMAAGGLGGVAGAMVKRGYESYRNNPGAGSGGVGNVKALGRAVAAGISAAPRGLVSGTRKGFQVNPKNFKDVAGAGSSGMAQAQASLTRAENSHQRAKEALQHPIEFSREKSKEFFGDLGEHLTAAGHRLAGISAEDSAALDLINKTTSNISKFKEFTNGDVEKYDKAYADLEKDILKKGSIQFENQTYDMDNMDELKKKFDERKNETIAKKMKKDYYEGGASYMATIAKEYKQNATSLGQETISKLNSELSILNLDDGNGKLLTDYNDLLKCLSDSSYIKNHLNEKHIAAINTLNKELSKQGKNIIIANQQKTQDQNDKGNNK